jgi:hypothetical protein
MKAVTGRQKLPGRGRETGWQWHRQRGRLADSPQAGRKAVHCREEEASRQREESSGRQPHRDR